MDSLFGIPLTSIIIGLLVLLAGALAVLAFIAIRQPLLVRMGLRNTSRRPSQTTLIVIGLMLSTLIISAAFATGDTVGYSVTNSVYRSFEEVDFILAFDSTRHEPGTPDYLSEADRQQIRGGARLRPRYRRHHRHARADAARPEPERAALGASDAGRRHRSGHGGRLRRAA